MIRDFPLSLALLAFLASISSANAQVISYERAVTCVEDAVHIARTEGTGIAHAMLGKLDRDLFTWRVMRHERENRDFIHYRNRIDGILTNASTGPAFTDVNLDSITFSRRRSRLVDLRLRTDGTRTRVVELVGRYETLRRSRQRDDRRREPIEYSVVLWVTASLDGCALVDLSWSNIRWSRHVLELE